MNKYKYILILVLFYVSNTKSAELTQGGYTLKRFEGNIPDIETKHKLDLLFEKTENGRTTKRSIEVKNWANANTVGYEQFKAYIESGHEFWYYFNNGLGDAMKTKFQNIFKNPAKAQELFDLNPNFFRNLSPGNINNADDLINMANDNTLKNHINWIK